jgi:hypothetical protein
MIPTDELFQRNSQKILILADSSSAEHVTLATYYLSGASPLQNRSLRHGCVS